ncbi:hypothetical protein MBLNU230_g0599t1 [Neophaeotheca triangularis]
MTNGKEPILSSTGIDTPKSGDSNIKPDSTLEGKAVPEAIVLDSAATTKPDGRQTFLGEAGHERYRPVETYEGIHRFDPQFQWEPKEEKRIVRRIDARICTWACLMFFALQLDRGNIQQALTDNMLDDLGISTNDYNTGQTIFYLSFLLAELPSQLISKKLGPDRWIPCQMVMWSLVASFQAFLSGRASFWVCRCLIGAIEGGFIPDTILYLTYWYKSNELPTRLSWFWVSYQSTSIVSAFMAYGLLRMRGIPPLMDGWRWLFALEGTLIGLIGIASWFYLPPSPTQTASRFRGKDGWFNENEEKLLVNRILRDDPSKGDMHNRQGLSSRMIWQCLADYHMWPIYLLGLSWMIPSNPMHAYLTLQLRSAGFDTFETNLLTMPAYVIFIINLLACTWLSEKLNERFLLATVSQIWVLPLVIALLVLPDSRDQWATWSVSMLLYAQPYVHAILVAITSRNAGSVRTRTVATALYNMTVQTSNILGVNIYRENDKPLYKTGNTAILALVCYNLVLFLATKAFYVGVNRRRDAKWNAMSKEERENYFATTTDQGNKRLDFRFAH